MGRSGPIQKHQTDKHHVEISAYAGLIPSPEMMERYEAMEPGFANRFMLMAEKEQESRHANDRALIRLEETYQRHRHKTFKAGQIFSFTCVLISIALAAFMVHKGFAQQALWVCLIMVAIIVALFLGRRLVVKSKDFNAKAN